MSTKLSDKKKHFFKLPIIVLLIFSLLLPLTSGITHAKSATFRAKAKVTKLKVAKKTKSSIKIKWKKRKKATGYEIYRSTSRKGKFKKIAVIKKTSFHNKKLKTSTKYFYKVRAYQKKNGKKTFSRFSSILKAKTKSGLEDFSSASSPFPISGPTGTPLSATTQLPQNTTTAAPTSTVSATNTPETQPTATTPIATLQPTNANTATPTPTVSIAPTQEPQETLSPTSEPPTTLVPVSYTQDLDYSEVTDKINNPDQGFYRPIYVSVKEDGVTYNENIITDATQLYHLRTDISAFSAANNGTADMELTEAALSGIDSLLAALYKKEKSAIIRFVYDPGLNGAINKEPAVDMIVTHITQLAPVLNKYPDTLTAIEVGLVGPWGEMHTSTIANAETINTLIETFLTNTVDIPILVRTPKMIYNYLGITINDLAAYTISSDSKAYRLGLFNDGYLGSDSDLGTYSNRETEVNWLTQQTSHLPYGGEVVIPGSTLHNIENCLPEMFLLDLSYLNIEWNYEVIDKWEASTYAEASGEDSLYYGMTAFEYIQNHMGYRFVLKDSVFTYPEDLSSLKIDLTLQNVGFGNLNRQKQATILFENSDGTLIEADTSPYSGESIYSISISKDILDQLTTGTHRVYIKFHNGNAKYNLHFANNLWNDTLQANHIGTITVP